MPTEPEPNTLFQVVRRAVEVCDPEGGDEALAGYLERFEDRDEPVTAVADVRAEATDEARRQDPGGLDPALTMAAAVTTYLAFRRDELDSDDRQLPRLAARAEFHDDPPDPVAAWLTERGVEL